MTMLYVTGAGVSADSGIPTFRGEDGYWTIGSVNYTPQEMATRQIYESDPGQFLLSYYRRFGAYCHVPPNDVHRWLADECNASTGGQPRGRLITQNIDGLDGRAGNADYVCIHGRLDMMTLYDYQMALHGRAQAAAARHDGLMKGGFTLRTAIQRGIPVEIVDPEPVDLGIPDFMADVTWHRMTAREWVG